MKHTTMSRTRPAIHPATLVHRCRELLARRLRILRKGRVIHIVFAPTVQDATEPRPKSATGPVAEELRQVGIELRQRLDRHALSRTVFVHLAIVEYDLGRHGYAALQSLPVELLHTALGQLAVVIGQVPGELGTLRTKVLDAMLARAPKAGDFGGNLALSVFNAPHKLEVLEAGVSDFFHAEQDWTRRNARPSATVVLPTLVDTAEGRLQPVMP